MRLQVSEVGVVRGKKYERFMAKVIDPPMWTGFSGLANI